MHASLSTFHKHKTQHCAGARPLEASSTRRRLATLATCNLNQWALDFSGNLDRVIQSILEALPRR